MNIPIIADKTSKTQVASGFAKSIYPKYAITDIVAKMNTTPIGALLPVNNPAIPTTNMKTIGTPHKSPIGSIPN